MAIVVVATFVLLFAMTGSLVIPLKALLTNVISIGAALGVVVWIFQEGHLEGLLSFTSGGIEDHVVVLVIAFAFGLAMDYEVFLLARIKELVDSGVETGEAVRTGAAVGADHHLGCGCHRRRLRWLRRGDLLVIKEVGVALSVAVIIDATLVRLLLVPAATMAVLGRHNWWAPAPLARLQRRWGVSE